MPWKLRGYSVMDGQSRAGSLFLPAANQAGMAAMIMRFNLTGRHVESRVRGRASEAKKLLEPGPKTARVPDKGKKGKYPARV